MNILITGGTGLIGRRLSELLLDKGYQVAFLSRKKENIAGIKVYEWNIDKQLIEKGSLEEADYVVHLAGTGIADKRWTEQRKKEIIDSRIEPIALINNYLEKNKIHLKGFISASAIGFYGGDTGSEKLTENSPAGNDFLSTCTKLWEATTQKIRNSQRIVNIRIGIVLSEKGGALPKLVQPIRLGLGAPLGSGEQYLSWIHIDDLCRIFIEAIENKKMQGAYNAVAPNPVTNEILTKTTAEILQKPLWLPNVPAFVLKLIFGEMGIVVLGGNFVLNTRLSKEINFQYKFSEIKTALQDLLAK